MKRVAAVHDISGYGKSSLTAVMPVLSACGIEVCPLPTAVLSNITGFFETYSYVDLTDTIPDYLAHWESLGLHFDSIYTGFLGSIRQIDMMKDMMNRFSSPLVLVDPVFGDDGKLFPGFHQDFVEKMKELVTCAHLITPNLTEAAGLLGRSMPETLREADAKEWLASLTDMGPSMAVITGIPGGDMVHTALYDRNSDTFTYLSHPHSPGRFPGTGDIFAAVLLGSLLSGIPLGESGARATRFVTNCILSATNRAEPIRGGLPIEPFLHTLYKGESL